MCIGILKSPGTNTMEAIEYSINQVTISYDLAFELDFKSCIQSIIKMHLKRVFVLETSIKSTTSFIQYKFDMVTEVESSQFFEQTPFLINSNFLLHLNNHDLV